MASTNKTTNYELSQFEGTDKPSWEADYNADMLIIDTNLKAVSDVADGASGSISTLADRVTTAEGNITTNANDIDALEARADALEAGQTSDDGRLDALETEQIMQNTAIEGNTQLGYNIARPYDSANTYSIRDYALFQNTLYKCTTAVTTGEAFDPTKWVAIKVMDEIKNETTFISFDVLSETTPTLTVEANPLCKTSGIVFGSSASTTQSLSNVALSQCDVTMCKLSDIVILNINGNVTFDALTFNESTFMEAQFYLKLQDGDHSTMLNNGMTLNSIMSNNMFKIGTAKQNYDESKLMWSEQEQKYKFRITTYSAPILVTSASTMSISNFKFNVSFIIHVS